jgi:hypothetical protein
MSDRLEGDVLPADRTLACNVAQGLGARLAVAPGHDSKTNPAPDGQLDTARCLEPRKSGRPMVSVDATTGMRSGDNFFPASVRQHRRGFERSLARRYRFH